MSERDNQRSKDDSFVDRRKDDRRKNGRNRPVFVPEDRRADLSLRMMARLVDEALFLALCAVYPVGILAGFAYLLAADGMMRGRSPGKRLFGLRVVRSRGLTPAGFKASILRNLTMAVISLFLMIPIVGWALFILVGCPMLVVDFILARTDPNGQRVGDILADTAVIRDGAILLKPPFGRRRTAETISAGTETDESGENPGESGEKEQK